MSCSLTMWPISKCCDCRVSDKTDTYNLLAYSLAPVFNYDSASALLLFVFSILSVPCNCLCCSHTFLWEPQPVLSLCLGLINYFLSLLYISTLFLQDLARWTDGGCRECECRDAQVTCYLRSCPTCPPGTLAITQEGLCCPECRQGMFLQSILCANVHVCLSLLSNLVFFSPPYWTAHTAQKD